MLALALVKKGVPVTLIEQYPDAPEDQRAATIHPPTIAMLVDLGLEKEMFSKEPTGGMESPLFHFRDRMTGELIAVFDISLLNGEVPFPYVVQWEQYKLVHAALPYIKASGLGEVRFLDQADRVVANRGLRRSHRDQRRRGNRNAARQISDRHRRCFKHGAAASPKSSSKASPGRSASSRSAPTSISVRPGKGYCTRNYFSDPDEWINLFKVKGWGPPGIWRGVFPVPEQGDRRRGAQHGRHSAPSAGHLSEERRLRGSLLRLYAVHQRVAATFNKGRILLAGDCAHVNNPIGGMGMNGGIHDAVNLADKLSDVWFGRADEGVLDRYTRQRRKAQVDYVQAQTIQNKKHLEEKDPVIRREHFDQLRRTSEDVALHKKFLYRSSLFDSLNSANAVE